MERMIWRWGRGREGGREAYGLSRSDDAARRGQKEEEGKQGGK
jgi:hypothetical protein